MFVNSFLNPVAPVAQLDRASGFEPEGREFESLRAHHFPLYLHISLDPIALGNYGFTLVLPSTLGMCGRGETSAELLKPMQANHLQQSVEARLFSPSNSDSVSSRSERLGARLPGPCVQVGHFGLSDTCPVTAFIQELPLPKQLARFSYTTKHGLRSRSVRLLIVSWGELDFTVLNGRPAAISESAGRSVGRRTLDRPSGW
jgi:hypothetical protein